MTEAHSSLFEASDLEPLLGEVEGIDDEFGEKAGEEAVDRALQDAHADLTLVVVIRAFRRDDDEVVGPDRVESLVEAELERRLGRGEKERRREAAIEASDAFVAEYLPEGVAYSLVVLSKERQEVSDRHRRASKASERTSEVHSPWVRLG